jgi:hypothetical protein
MRLVEYSLSPLFPGGEGQGEGGAKYHHSSMKKCMESDVTELMAHELRNLSNKLLSRA